MCDLNLFDVLKDCWSCDNIMIDAWYYFYRQCLKRGMSLSACVGYCIRVSFYVWHNERKGPDVNWSTALLQKFDEVDLDEL